MPSLSPASQRLQHPGCAKLNLPHAAQHQPGLSKARLLPAGESGIHALVPLPGAGEYGEVWPLNIPPSIGNPVPVVRSPAHPSCGADGTPSSFLQAGICLFGLSAPPL